MKYFYLIVVIPAGILAAFILIWDYDGCAHACCGVYLSHGFLCFFTGMALGFVSGICIDSSRRLP